VFNAPVEKRHSKSAFPARRASDESPGNAHETDRAGSHAQSSHLTEPSALLVTIYLSDGEAHEQVEVAVGSLLTASGLQIDSRDDPVVGSWFRQMKATFSSPTAREAALVATHIADTRFILAQDAAVTATLMQGVGPVLASLHSTKDAVVRLGAVLIVKVDWVVTVNQLTAAQQAMLDHRPDLASAPGDILMALKLPSADQAREGAPLAVEDG